MASQPGQIDLIAIIAPRAGKVDRVVELLNEVAAYVRAKEPGTVRYVITRSVAGKGGEEEEEVVMLESYQDTAALAAHGSSDAFKAFQKKLADEGLVGKPMVLKFVKNAGGFSSRL